jgi:hypothetical protein
MKARSVEADLGITPTIAHVPTGIVHELPPAEDAFEKLPVGTGERTQVRWGLPVTGNANT